MKQWPIIPCAKEPRAGRSAPLRDVWLTWRGTRLRLETRPLWPPSRDPRVRPSSRCQGGGTASPLTVPFNKTHTRFLALSCVHPAHTRKEKQKEILHRSHLVESVPLGRGVRETSGTLVVGGAEVLALRHQHLDLQIPADVYELV